MARLKRDARIETREARRKLETQHEPVWRTIHRGLAIGYRKGERGGAWYVRRLVGARYVKERLGEADDFADANGGDVLSFAEAQRKALGEEQQLIATATARSCTVGDALDSWLSAHRARAQSESAAKLSEAKAKQIRAALGSRQVATLTAAAIQEWLDTVATTMRQVRGKGGTSRPAKRSKAAEGMDPRELKRRRQATANRLLAVLKAALNHAWRDGTAATDAEWRRVRPFRNADQPRLRFLSQAECQRLLNAAPPDFRKLAMGALYTGLRQGELLTLRAGDVQRESLHVGPGKSGKARNVPLSKEGAGLFAELAAGKSRDALLFERANGISWHRIAVMRAMRETSNCARLDPPATFHDLRRSYASLLINAGADAATIQKLLGHSDTRMTIRVYAHLLDKTLAAEVESKLPSFGFKPGKVRALRPKGA